MALVPPDEDAIRPSMSATLRSKAIMRTPTALTLTAALSIFSLMLATFLCAPAISFVMPPKSYDLARSTIMRLIRASMHSIMTNTSPNTSQGSVSMWFRRVSLCS